jgi:hypothetical protein
MFLKGVQKESIFREIFQKYELFRVPKLTPFLLWGRNFSDFDHRDTLVKTTCRLCCWFWHGANTAAQSSEVVNSLTTEDSYFPTPSLLLFPSHSLSPCLPLVAVNF